MATAAALLSHLRRSRPSSLLSLPRVVTSHHPPPLPSPFSSTPHSPSPAFLGAFRTRAFSTPSSHDPELETDSFDLDSPVSSELAKVIADSAGAEDNPVFPVSAVISMLDSFHDVTGFPWWINIVSSTLALRIVLLCPLVFTLHKCKRIGEFVPKLPPPFPPPFSGKSYIRHFLFFEKERKAVGCPSYVWPLVPLMIQVPCFFLGMISIRRMSLDGHPGFNCGGVLWFQNLTELSHGYSGFIFPFLMTGLHYIIVQVSFRKPLVEGHF